MAGWTGTLIQPTATPVYFQILESASGVQQQIVKTKSIPAERREADALNSESAVDPSITAKMAASEQPQALSAEATQRMLDIKTEYISKIAWTLNQKKEYPDLARRMRQQGKLKVRFILERDGRILNAEVIEQSKYENLNQAAKKLLTEIKSFEPFPQGVTDQQWAVTVPIEYIM